MIGRIMLVTTCPDCETTFRVTAGILEQAGGQVRCGRCAVVFNANKSLREHPDTETRSIHDPEPEAQTEIPDVEPMPDDEVPAGRIEADPGSVSGWYLTDAPPFEEFTAESASETAADDEADAETETDAESDTTAEAEAEAETEADAEPAVEPEPEPEAESAAKETASEPAPETAPATSADDAAHPPTDKDIDSEFLPPLVDSGPRRRWPWAVAAGLLGLALGLQLIHQFRNELSAVPGIGSALQFAYTVLGFETPRDIDLARYALLDLTAVAEPVSAEQGWLIIETRVQNNSPRVQPVPHIFVALLDRWQDTIAGRYFSPDEYVVNAMSDYSSMRSGSTIDAQFVIVDPGPGATGFELQICTPTGQSFVCDGDAALE